MNPAHDDLLRAIKDPAVSPAEIVNLMSEASPNSQAATKQAWIALATDARLEAWRRIVSIQILLNRHISYPQPLQEFLRDPLQLLEVSASAVQDMTIAQNLPFERIGGERARMAPLSILTAVGPAAIYFTVGDSDESVRRATVFPGIEQLSE